MNGRAAGSTHWPLKKFQSEIAVNFGETRNSIVRNFVFGLVGFSEGRVGFHVTYKDEAGNDGFVTN